MPQPHKYSPICQCFECRKGPPKPDLVQLDDAIVLDKMQYYMSEDMQSVVLECFPVNTEDPYKPIRLELPTRWLVDISLKQALMAKQS